MNLFLVIFMTVSVALGSFFFTVSSEPVTAPIDTNVPVVKEDIDSTSSNDFSDIVGGWESTAEGGSYYVFNQDKTFYWYKSANDLKDNYYNGPMEVLRGADAISELGLSYEGVISNIVNSEGEVTMDDIYALILKPNYLISGGIDKSSTLSSSSEMKLLFVYIDDNSAQAHNYTSGDTYYFQKK